MRIQHYRLFCPGKYILPSEGCSIEGGKGSQLSEAETHPLEQVQEPAGQCFSLWTIDKHRSGKASALARAKNSQFTLCLHSSKPKWEERKSSKIWITSMQPNRHPCSRVTRSSLVKPWVKNINLDLALPHCAKDAAVWALCSPHLP